MPPPRILRPFLRDIWTVGVVDAPIEVFATDSLPHVNWMPETVTDGYLADPFPHPAVPDALLAEEYSYLDGRGRLVAVRWPDGEPLPHLSRGLELGYHAAYPFTFEHDGERYCVPDTGQALVASLYRWSGVCWEYVKPLIQGLQLVDATLIRDGERWWMFCSAGGSPSTLLIFHADDILGEWRAHARNPVKSDLASSRPGGTPFYHQGHWYRPSQDHSHTYGGAIAINRIDALSPSAYAETTVNILRPDPAGPYPRGLHTLSAWGKRTLVDGKRYRHRSARHLLHSSLTRLRLRRP
jgi:hypothetical protein